MKHLELMNKIILVTGIARWLRVRDGVLHRLVLAATSTSATSSSTARRARTAWAYWTMITCNVLSPAGVLVQAAPHEHPGDVRHLDLRQHRHVVRALRHHRDVAAPRLPAVVVGLLPPDDRRHLHVRRHARPLLHAVPALHPLDPDDRDRRGQGRAARGRSAPRPRRARRRPRRTAAAAARASDGDAESWPPRPRDDAAIADRRAGAHPRASSTPRASASTPPRSCATPATRSSTRTRRSRSTGWTRRWACGDSKLGWIVLPDRPHRH